MMRKRRGTAQITTALLGICATSYQEESDKMFAGVGGMGALCLENCGQQAGLSEMCSCTLTRSAIMV